MVDHSEILAARNRTRLAHKIYTHEATMSLLVSDLGMTVSQCFDALALWFLSKRGKQLGYISDCDKLKIKNIDRVLSYNS